MTINPTIYQINLKHREIKSIIDTAEIVEKIIRLGYSKAGIKIQPQLERITQFQKDNFTYFLFLHNSEEKDSDWAKFLPIELVEGRNFTQQKISLILFVKTEYHLFCILGGNSYRLVVPFIEQSFGLDLYDRIIEPNEDELTSIKSRGLTGQRIGMKDQYRDHYKIINYIKFGKLPQELHVKLCQKNTDLYFTFLKDKASEKLQITAGKGIKLRKSLDFNKVHNSIHSICDILTITQTEYLSSYRQINDFDYIDKVLKPTLIEKLYNHVAYIKGMDKDIRNRFDFDFCNPNSIDKFYEAEKYILKEKSEKGLKPFKEVREREDIFEAVINRALDVIGEFNQFKFMVYLQGVRVASYKGSRTTDGELFLLHISAEFNIQNHSIFLIDGKWYRLKELFIDDLKSSTKNILKSRKAQNHILHIPWDKNSISQEKDYNKSYKNLKNYIVLDRLIIDGIELCDLLYFENRTLYLIHVKYGFESKVRELTNQIELSARRLQTTLGAKDSKYLSNLYDKIVKENLNHDGLSLNEFQKLFDGQITYILAITSHLKEDLLIEDNIDKYKSNIARFSLIQCSSTMKSDLYDLLIYQIPRA